MIVVHDLVTTTYNLLAHAPIISNLLSLRTAKLLCASIESLIKIVLLASTLCVIIHAGCVDWYFREVRVNKSEFLGFGSSRAEEG